MDDSSKSPGNFRVLVKLLSKHDEIVKKNQEEGRQNDTFLGHDFQNELMKAMQVLCPRSTEFLDYRSIPWSL